MNSLSIGLGSAATPTDATESTRREMKAATGLHHVYGVVEEAADPKCSVPQESSVSRPFHTAPGSQSDPPVPELSTQPP